MVLKIIIILDILLQGNTKIPPLSPLQYQFQFIPNFKFVSFAIRSRTMRFHQKPFHNSYQNYERKHAPWPFYSIFLSDKSSPFLHEFTKKVECA